MKKLLTVAVAGAMLLAGGCMKVDNTRPDHIGYLGMYFYSLTTSFITDEAGERSIKISGGSREAYENPEYKTASFIELTLNLGTPEHSEWEGEYELTAPFSGSIGRMELREKWPDETTGETKTDGFTHSLLSGTIVIEHVKDAKYKIVFSGYTMPEGEMYTISAEITNNVKIVVPTEEEEEG